MVCSGSSFRLQGRRLPPIQRRPASMPLRAVHRDRWVRRCVAHLGVIDSPAATAGNAAISRTRGQCVDHPKSPRIRGCNTVGDGKRCTTHGLVLLLPRAGAERQANLKLQRELAIKARKWPREIESAVIERKVMTGISADQVLMAWGRPIHINETIRVSVKSEQWLYSLSSYV